MGQGRGLATAVIPAFAGMTVEFVLGVSAFAGLTVEFALVVSNNRPPSDDGGFAFVRAKTTAVIPANAGIQCTTLLQK